MGEYLYCFVLHSNFILPLSTVISQIHTWKITRLSMYDHVVFQYYYYYLFIKNGKRTVMHLCIHICLYTYFEVSTSKININTSREEISNVDLIIQIR